MKLTFTFLFFCLTFNTFAQTEKDSTKSATEVHGVFVLTNNGIAPVPAFSLGKPALMSKIFIQKGNFSFETNINYALEIKPWDVTSWLRYKIPTAGRWSFRVGATLSLFFTRKQGYDYQNNPVEIQITQQYLGYEAATFYKLSPRTSINLMYWNVYGLEFDAVKWGHFLSLSANISKIPLSNSLQLSLMPHLFYLKNAIPYEGVFSSLHTAISLKKCPIACFVQLIQPISVKPATDFNWNTGISYAF